MPFNNASFTITDAQVNRMPHFNHIFYLCNWHDVWQPHIIIRTITTRVRNYFRTRRLRKTKRDLLCSLILLEAPSSAAAAPDAQSKQREQEHWKQKQWDLIMMRPLFCLELGTCKQTLQVRMCARVCIYVIVEPARTANKPSSTKSYENLIRNSTRVLPAARWI